MENPTITQGKLETILSHLGSEEARGFAIYGLVKQGKIAILSPTRICKAIQYYKNNGYTERASELSERAITLYEEEGGYRDGAIVASEAGMEEKAEELTTLAILMGNVECEKPFDPNTNQDITPINMPKSENLYPNKMKIPLEGPRKYRPLIPGMQYE